MNISNTNNIRFDQNQTNFHQLPDELLLTILQFISGEDNEHRDISICFDLNPISLVNKKFELLTKSHFLKGCRLESDMILSIKNVMKVIPIIKKITYEVKPPYSNLPDIDFPVMLLKIVKNKKQKNIVDIEKFEHVGKSTSIYKDYEFYEKNIFLESKNFNEICFESNAFLLYPCDFSLTDNISLYTHFFQSAYKINLFYKNFMVCLKKKKESNLNDFDLSEKREEYRYLGKSIELIEKKLRSHDNKI